MGCLSSSESTSDDGARGAAVVLHVYDLTPINNYLYWFGLGIFHSGIEGITINIVLLWWHFGQRRQLPKFPSLCFNEYIKVHGLEYGFGAHDYPTSGVFEVEPRKCPGFLYRCSITLGYINIHPHQVRAFIEDLASEYHGDTYHLISKNCNHFTDDASNVLTGRSIPGWVNRLAWLGAACNCLLPEFLKLPTVKQPIPEYHGFSEDGSESLSVITSHEPIESDDTDQDKHLLSPSTAGEVTTVKEAHR